QAKPKDKSYRLADGGGMYLEVMPNGSKYWRLKYRFDGKEKRLALGVYPLVSLTSAREKSRLARAQLSEGNDPGELKKQEKLNRRISTSNTFSAIAGQFIQKRITEGAAPVTIDKLRWII